MTKPEHGWRSSPPEILKHGVAVVSVAGALASALWLQDHLVGAPVPLFLCAVMLSAWFGGMRPGLLAAALSLLAFDYYFVPPLYSLAVAIEELPRLLLVAASILFVGLLTATQHIAAELLGRARDELDGSVQELRRTNEALRGENAERKRVEAALRETEQRFRDYAETASDWLWETGPDHRFLITSERSASIPPSALVKGGGTLRVIASRSRRNGALILPLTKRTSRFAALCTGWFGQMDRRSTSKRAASRFSIPMAVSLAIAGSAATSPRRFVATRRSMRCAGHKRSWPTSLV